MNKKIFLITLFLFQAAKAGTGNYKPIVEIESPKYGSRFEIGQEVEFKGRANDLEDGELSGDAFTWTADGDFIAKGNLFTTSFQKGYHMIILTAVDSEGLFGQASVFIIVGIPEPVKEVKVEVLEPNEPKVKETPVEKKNLPHIEFTYVPSFGSLENLRGKLLNGDPNQFGVAVYIMVGTVWSSKPSIDNPVTKINTDGTWICDITVSEEDELAIKIAAYLIPIGYKPPTAYRNFYILKEIENKCLANIEVTRKLSGKIESKKPILTRQNLEFDKYFPLAMGNTWRYRKTVFQNRNAFHYSQQIVLEDGPNGFPKKGQVLFSVGRTQGETLEKSIESYTISSFAENKEGKIWEVKVEGELPRDGRYASFTVSQNPKTRWLYKDNAVWEIIDGEYLGTSTQNQTLMAILEPGVMVFSSSKQETVSLWAVGSVLTGAVETPTGRFENCLKNCTIIKGENLEDILTKSASPRFSNTNDAFGSLSNQDFGKFVTLSYFAEGIGLVLECQFDSKGQIVYEMVLTDYKVK